MTSYRISFNVRGEYHEIYFRHRNLFGLVQYGVKWQKWAWPLFDNPFNFCCFKRNRCFGSKERIVLTPRSTWCLTAILLRKETDHTNFALNIFLGIKPVPISWIWKPFPPNLMVLTKRSWTCQKIMIATI